MKYSIFLTLVVTILLASWGYNDQRPLSLTESTTVTELLQSFGEDLNEKKPNKNLKGVSPEVGEQLFKKGFSKKPKGGKSKKQSKHFVCTSCHNVDKEDPNLAESNPETRLQYTAKNKLPFLQGTTMYGAVSRETYYNGDYDKKYGDLVKPARNDIRGAIQLCAVECAQGRKLKDWELESILAYLWTIDIKISDLDLSENQIDSLEDGNVSDGKKIALLKSKYLQASPAHFIPPPVDRRLGVGLVGNSKNGKLIYDGSCLHCHFEQRYSFLHLDHSKLSFKHLKRKAPTYHRHSIYQVTRWGVPTKSGKNSYMPQYPVEKLSDQQLADLMAYITIEAES